MARPTKQTTKISIVNGVWMSKNLSFLSQFMAAFGISAPDIASRIGITRQTMHHYLSTDDMKLSTAETIFEVYGFRLYFDLVKDEEVTEDGDIEYDDMAYHFDFDKFLANYRAGANKRLSFLRIAMAREGLTYRDVEDRCGLGRTTMDYYFKQDDMYVAKLMSIVEMLGFTLHVTISDKFTKKDLEGPKEKPRQLVSFETDKIQK